MIRDLCQSLAHIVDAPSQNKFHSSPIILKQDLSTSASHIPPIMEIGGRVFSMSNEAFEVVRDPELTRDEDISVNYRKRPRHSDAEEDSVDKSRSHYKISKLQSSGNCDRRRLHETDSNQREHTSKFRTQERLNRLHLSTVSIDDVATSAHNLMSIRSSSGEGFNMNDNTWPIVHRSATSETNPCNPSNYHSGLESSGQTKISHGSSSVYSSSCGLYVLASTMDVASSLPELCSAVTTTCATVSSIQTASVTFPPTSDTLRITTTLPETDSTSEISSVPSPMEQETDDDLILALKTEARRAAAQTDLGRLPVLHIKYPEMTKRVVFVGVHKSSHGQFEARIKRKGCTHYLGMYKTQYEAARAYDAAVLRLRGKIKARLNFPAEFGLSSDQQAIKVIGFHNIRRAAARRIQMNREHSESLPSPISIKRTYSMSTEGYEHKSGQIGGHTPYLDIGVTGCSVPTTLSMQLAVSSGSDPSGVLPTLTNHKTSINSNISGYSATYVTHSGIPSYSAEKMAMIQIPTDTMTTIPYSSSQITSESIQVSQASDHSRRLATIPYEPVPYVGVSRKSAHSYEVKLRDGTKTKYIGTYGNARTAAHAYDEAVIQLRGKSRAVVNFPEKYGLSIDRKAVKWSRLRGSFSSAPVRPISLPVHSNISQPININTTKSQISPRMQIPMSHHGSWNPGYVPATHRSAQCICRTTPPTGQYIACMGVNGQHIGGCNGWVHPSCVGFTSPPPLNHPYICAACLEASRHSALQNTSRTDVPQFWSNAPSTATNIIQGAHIYSVPSGMHSQPLDRRYAMAVPGTTGFWNVSKN